MSAKWTFMVYLAGNNSLSDAADVELKEMRQVGSSDAVKVMAFVAQRRVSGTAQRFQVGKGGASEKAEQLNKVDSGDPQTVIDFVRWAVAQAPADRYALVLWNHGGGWEPDDLDQIYSEVRGTRAERGGGVSDHEMNRYTSRKLARTFFTPSVKTILSLPSKQERAICSDDGSGHSLDTIELGRLLKLVKKEIGHKLDLLGMDACLMSNLEVAYQVQNEAAVVAGSEELEPGAGWDYSTLLGDLARKPAMEGRDLGERVVARYVESYRNLRGQWPITQCAVDTQRLGDFSQAIDALGKALRPQLKAGWSKVYSAQARSVTFGGGSLCLTDLATFCRNLAGAGLNAAVKKAAAAVRKALQPGGYVIAEGHLGPTVADVGGVSVYLPPPLQDVSRYYKDLTFSKEHRWAPLLQAYHDAARAG
jgi:hypothetical protein